MRSFRLFPTYPAILACCFALAISEAPAQKPEPKRPALPAGFVAEYDVKYVPERRCGAGTRHLLPRKTS